MRCDGCDAVRQGVEEDEEESEHSASSKKEAAAAQRSTQKSTRVFSTVCGCGFTETTIAPTKSNRRGKRGPGKLSRSQPNACLSQVTPMAPGVVHISCAPQQHGKPSGQQQLGLSRGCTTFGHQVANACRHPATAWLAANPLGMAIDALDALSVCNMADCLVELRPTTLSVPPHKSSESPRDNAVQQQANGIDLAEERRTWKSCSSKRLMRSGSIVNDPAFGLRSGRGWWGKHVNLGGAGTASGLGPLPRSGISASGVSDLGSSISNSPSSSFNPAIFRHFDATCSVKSTTLQPW